ncbi:MAG: hypothetical protein LBV72_07315 [Tannerella sp.]|jgi:hypothetical protein|nr:hypothetical protein [Tannerella sp.]
MTDKNKYIEELLERFFEGETSNTEEQFLYRFFAGEDVPEHLLPYKSAFTYFESGLKNEFTEEVVPVRRIRKSKWILWTGIAAALLALVLLGQLYMQKPFDPYEGSYIVRNGVRITDPKIIRPELEATVQRVLQQEEKMEGIVVSLMEKENYSQSIEEQIQLQKNEILEHFQDENIRKEVERIMNYEL